MYNMSFSVGMVIGPLLAGFVYEKFGFLVQMLVFGGLLVAFSPVVFYFWMLEKKKKSMLSK